MRTFPQKAVFCFKICQQAIFQSRTNTNILKYANITIKYFFWGVFAAEWFKLTF